MNVYILLGSNMGNRLGYIQFAKYFLNKDLGNITKESNLYETKAWGYKSKKDYINQIVLLETKLPPKELMQQLLLIEQKAGRKRFNKMTDRTLDLDILYYNEEIIDTKDLRIPHPKIQERKFVLQILNEIAPNYLHPILLKKNSELLDICPDKLEGKIFSKK